MYVFSVEKGHRVACLPDETCQNSSGQDIKHKLIWCLRRGARDVMVIVVGNGHGDTSSNPGRDWLLFS